MFGIMSVVFPLFFLAAAVIIVVVIVRGAAEHARNSASPVLTVEAAVVAKRQEDHHHIHGDSHQTFHGTTYYATFQVESGDRMELRLRGREYGQLAEGDRGRLTFQGTRYLGFERQL